MGKREKLVDLKPKNITDDQLKRVQTTITNINRVQMEIGSMESRKHALLHNVTSLNDQLSNMQQEFSEAYGTTDINIQDGTINYTSDDGGTN
tara:strand:+ start:10439 stop:10714 length:276 start_codon:yes stop_codon:yes gene_type:complete